MRNRHKEHSPFLAYAMGLLALAGLITAAFFAPQVVFWIQDSILCRNTELGVRENVGAEALNTAYEESLSKRMRNFAEGISAGENYYVAVQELEVGDEINNYLYSESGLYSEMLQAFVDGGLLPYDFWISTAVVRQWKQYVIYSDNYAKGVNFILWYLDVESSGGVTLKLLVDAEDNTIYAVKLEDSEKVWMMDDTSGYLREYIHNPHVAMELWYYFANHFGALGSEERDAIIKAAEAGELEAAFNVHILEEDYEADADEAGEREAAEILPDYGWKVAVGDQAIGYYSEDGNRMVFRLPYGEAVLNIMIDTEKNGGEIHYREEYSEEGSISWNETLETDWAPYSNIIIGVQEIYEMIPEFA